MFVPSSIAIVHPSKIIKKLEIFIISFSFVIKLKKLIVVIIKEKNVNETSLDNRNEIIFKETVDHLKLVPAVNISYITITASLLYYK